MIEALTLYCVRGVGPMRYRILVDLFGSAGKALTGDAELFAKAVGPGAEKARHDAGAVRRARRLMRRCRESRIGVLAYGTEGYPERLANLHHPPAVLFTRGRRELLLGPCVAVVGSRRATAYGRRVAGALGAGLAMRGRCVVSGMAIGIDAEAHRGALPGPTAAVLGSGVDVPSPAGNTRLYREILKHGVIVSEFAPGTRAEPGHFPRRNRIIAALATDVVVVEASRRSGALITVDHALELGREIHAVPGPIDRATSEGTNRLIAQGAGIVVDAEIDDAHACAPPSLPEGGLRRILEALPAAPVTVEEVAGTTGLPAEQVGASLTILEIRGYVTPTRDGRVMRTPGRQPGMVREGAA